MLIFIPSAAKSLSTKIAQWKDLFLDEQGNCKPVPAWEGLGDGKTFYADPKVLSGELRTIRGGCSPLCFIGRASHTPLASSNLQRFFAAVAATRRYCEMLAAAGSGGL